MQNFQIVLSNLKPDYFGEQSLFSFYVFLKSRVYFIHERVVLLEFYFLLYPIVLRSCTLSSEKHTVYDSML